MKELANSLLDQKGDNGAGSDGVQWGWGVGWGLLFPLRLLRFLTCVNVRVLLHIGFLVEPLPAVLTGVWPRVGVDEEVRGKGGGAFERLAAHFAFEAFFLFKYTKTKIVFDCIIYVKRSLLWSSQHLRVDVHVLLQTDGVAKGLPANAAAEGSGSAVRAPDVHLQPVRGGEHLKQNRSFNDNTSATR